MYVFLQEKAGELAMQLSWMNIKDEDKKLAKEIKIEDIGELKEFGGCKIKIDKFEQSAKFTQSVMIQSLDKISAGKRASDTSRTKHNSKKARTWQDFDGQGPI